MSRRERFWLACAAEVALATAIAGCGVSASSNPSYVGCKSDTDCDGGTCVHGFCTLLVGPGACDVDGGLVADSQKIPCYTGPANTEGVGACKAGQRQCIGGVLSACLGEVTPAAEKCDGVDDNCDGTPDNILQQSCVGTGMFGACNYGIQVCQGQDIACEATVTPSPEICDNKDDNCDNIIDGTSAGPVTAQCYPAGTTGCVDNGDGTFTCKGLCQPGVKTCTNGSFGACVGDVTPQPEIGGVAGQDDDCDGVIDNGVLCKQGQACYSGPAGSVLDNGSNGSICKAGTLDCSTTPPTCSGEVLPGTETCANMGTDDDCNGVIDDIPTLGDPCTDNSKLGQCKYGVLQCNASNTLSCVTNPKTAEICDGKDNDCDGVVDNGFNLLTDPNNCGKCGNVCGSGLTCCNGQCMNTDTSPQACGGCGNVCGSGLTCCSGNCVDLTSDKSNCTACGSACGSGQMCCSTGCMDTRSDVNNCGTCGNRCASGEMCCGGVCALPTEPACTGCPMTCTGGEVCCNGSCVDTQTDANNCNMCGKSCSAGQICCGGSCVSSTTTAHCGTCSNACGGSQLCCSGACVASNDANCGSCSNACGANTSCCNGTSCTSIDTDTNCGGCGITCAQGTTCSSGKCCLTGQTNCAGSCKLLASDPENCGACGNMCNQGEQCRMGCCCKGQSCRCPTSGGP